MNERIKKLRKLLKMNQTEFGTKIGVKQSSIAAYENGSRIPLDTVINSICREFGVSEAWLRDGEGEMRLATPTDELDQMLRKYGLPRFLRGLFLRYAKLSPKAQEEVEAQIREWALELAEQADEPEDAMNPVESNEPQDYVPLSEAEIEAKVEDYRALLKRGRAVRLALGHGTPPQTKVSNAFSNNGSGETGSFGDDIA